MRSFTNLLIVFALIASANLIRLSSRKQQQQKSQQPQDVSISKPFDLKQTPTQQPTVIISKVTLDENGNEVSEEIQPQQPTQEEPIAEQQPTEVEPTNQEEIVDDVDEEAKTA